MNQCYIFPDVDLDSDSSYYGSSNEGRKSQDNLDNKEQEELVSVIHRNPRRIRWG